MSLDKALAALYPLEASSRRVVDGAGLDANQIVFTDTAIDRWHSIVREAEKNGKIENLFNVVFGEYGGNQELRYAYFTYCSATDETPGSSGRDSRKRNELSTLPCRIIAGVLLLVAVFSLVGIGWFATSPFNC